MKKSWTLALLWDMDEREVKGASTNYHVDGGAATISENDDREEREQRIGERMCVFPIHR